MSSSNLKYNLLMLTSSDIGRYKKRIHSYWVKNQLDKVASFITIENVENNAILCSFANIQLLSKISRILKIIAYRRKDKIKVLTFTQEYNSKEFIEMVVNGKFN